MLYKSLVIVNGVVWLGDLPLGSERDLRYITTDKLWQAVISAIGWSDYNNIITSRGFKIH